MTAKVDFNALEKQAKALIANGLIRDAINIYILMADGDPSLDGGYLGQKLGQCYELLGEPIVASYWYARAVDESAEIRADSVNAIKRLRPLAKEYLLSLGIGIQPLDSPE